MADTGCDTSDAIAAGKLDSVRQSDFYPRALRMLNALLTAVGAISGFTKGAALTDSGSMLAADITDAYQVLYSNVSNEELLSIKIFNRTGLPIVVSLDGSTDYYFLPANGSLNIDLGSNGIQHPSDINIKYDGDSTADAAIIAADTGKIIVSVLYSA